MDPSGELSRPFPPSFSRGTSYPLPHELSPPSPPSPADSLTLLRSLGPRFSSTADGAAAVAAVCPYISCFVNSAEIKYDVRERQRQRRGSRKITRRGKPSGSFPPSLSLVLSGTICFHYALRAGEHSPWMRNKERLVSPLPLFLGGFARSLRGPFLECSRIDRGADGATLISPDRLRLAAMTEKKRTEGDREAPLNPLRGGRFTYV